MQVIDFRECGKTDSKRVPTRHDRLCLVKYRSFEDPLTTRAIFKKVIIHDELIERDVYVLEYWVKTKRRNSPVDRYIVANVLEPRVIPVQVTIKGEKPGGRTVPWDHVLQMIERHGQELVNATVCDEVISS